MRIARREIAEPFFLDKACCTIECNYKESNALSSFIERGTQEIGFGAVPYADAHYELVKFSEKDRVGVGHIDIAEHDRKEDGEVTYMIQGPSDHVNGFGEIIKAGIEASEEKIESSEVLERYKGLFESFLDGDEAEVEMEIE